MSKQHLAFSGHQGFFIQWPQDKTLDVLVSLYTRYHKPEIKRIGLGSVSFSFSFLSYSIFICSIFLSVLCSCPWPSIHCIAEDNLEFLFFLSLPHKSVYYSFIEQWPGLGGNIFFWVKKSIDCVLFRFSN